MTKKRAIRSPTTSSRSAIKAKFELAFAEVAALIENARHRAYQAADAELVGLYWQIGQYISRKLETAEWGRWSRKSTSSLSGKDAARASWVYAAQSLSHASVLRDVSQRQESVTTGDTIIVDTPSDRSERVQANGSARVLYPHGNSGAMG